MSFISPTCIGYLADHVCKGQDPLVTYEREGSVAYFSYPLTSVLNLSSFSPESVLWTLLDLITNGETALITTPPEPTASFEAMKFWVRNNCRTINPLNALSIGTAAFNSTCANIHTNGWLGVVQQSINRDIVAVQRHPAIIYEYRRFVVIRGKKDQSGAPISVRDF